MDSNLPTGETMNEGSDVPPTDPNFKKSPPDGMDGASEVCIPASALASPGEDDQMQSPMPGDLVQFQSEGRVSRIEGDNAYVKVESINGKPLTAKAAAVKDAPETEGAGEFAQLKQDAEGRMM